jgi:hypothetical protein
LVAFLSSDASAALVENKEIFLQILSAIDPQTYEFLFAAPDPN